MLEFVLFLDRELSRWLCVSARPRRPVTKLACLLLEWSGHGVLWFAICGLLFLLYLLTSDPSHLSLAWNVLVLLGVDIVAVAPLKLYFKRSRPPTNSGTIALSVSSVDKYAFPSGHASRAVALAIYFTLSRFLPPLVWAGWAVLVCLSRVVGGRHHLLDVLVGAGAGLAVFETSRYLGLLTLSLSSHH